MPVTDSGNGQAQALRVQGLSRRFGGIRAVSDVDLDVEHGDRVSVIGPNGAGKSTLFNLIAGLYKPTGGTVELFGEDITRLPSRKRAQRGLTRTFQTSKLFLDLTVADNLYLSLAAPPRSVNPLRSVLRDAERSARVRELAEQVGLAGQTETPASELSHGEQRQLEVGMALGGDPKLLLLDEPAAGFSPSERAHLVDMLTNLAPSITLLLIEHDMDIALVIGDRIVVMHEGKKLMEGTPDDIRQSTEVHEIYLGKRHEDT